MNMNVCLLVSVSWNGLLDEIRARLPRRTHRIFVFAGLVLTFFLSSKDHLI
jgi:hypothetical protein